MLSKNAAQYMSAGSSSFRSARHRRRSFPRVILSAFLAFMFLLTLLSSSFGAHLSLASAAPVDEAKVQDNLGKMYDNYIGDDKDSEDPAGTLMNKFYADSAANQSYRGEDSAGKEEERGSFASVLGRLFTPDYINRTPNASAPSGFPNKDVNCSPNATGAGTLIYHNCDVPNIFTEFLQDVASNIGNSGAQNAEVQSAKLNWAWFGLPSGVPNGKVPENPAQRTEKFTAMELYGYNLRYTSYSGEWDRIKVLTEARALSNFGLMDHLKMAGTSVTTGIAESLDRVATGFVSDITSGDIIGAIGGFFTNSVEGFASGSIHSALDTSDLNVFNTNAWYRVGYGDTLYNARELTSEEISAQAEAQLLAAIEAKYPTDAKAPEDLRAIKNPPKDPLEAISSCIVKTNQNGSNSVWSSNHKGFTEDQCESRAKKSADAYNDKVKAYNKELDDAKDEDTPRRKTFPAAYKWDREGTQKEETLAQWQKNNASFFAGGVKYNVGCDLNTNNSNRAANLSAFKQCWNQKYPQALETFLQQEQEDINSKWFEKAISSASLQAWLQEDQKRNFNAPWNRFVCVDDNGKDILDSRGLLIPAYNPNGTLNPACDQPVRPPIQNGLFGNGYDSTGTVQADTRHPGLISLLDAIFPVNSFMSWLANLGLLLAGFMTRISNTLINLSFSPVLETLGLNDIVVKGIEGFRDGIFFPIVVVVAGVGGIMLLVNGVKGKNYGSQMMSAAMMALTVITGVVLMYKPVETVKAVDVIPAQMEALVIGSIYDISAQNDDPLCTSSGTKDKGSGTNESTRTLMCENWRTFLFNPWVAGQYGTDYKNLDTAKMQNSNKALVGDASVVMGDGITAKNWALYQLDTMSAGTTTASPSTLGIGGIDPDFYRIVDMQAGPKNGAASDGRYFEMWSGDNSGGRMTVGLLAPVAATTGAITVLFYSIAKIQITFVTTLMVLLLPVMFLIGVHPTAGRMKLKQYFGTLAGLILQRIVLVVILAVFFLVMVGVGQTSGNYWINALLSVIICIVFLYIRKPLLNAIFTGISNAAGGPIGARFISNPAQFAASSVGVGGQGIVGNTLNRWRTTAAGAVTGAVGGYIANGREGMREGIKQSVDRNRDQLTSKQRRIGYRPVEKLVNSARAGTRATVEDIASHRVTKKVANDTMLHSVEHKTYMHHKELFDTAWESAGEDNKRIIGDDQSQTRQILDASNGEWISEPKDVDLSEFLPSSAGEARKMKRVIRMQQRADEFRKDTMYEGIDEKVVHSGMDEDVLSAPEESPNEDKAAIHQQARDRSRTARTERERLLDEKPNNPMSKAKTLQDKERAREDLAYTVSGNKARDEEQVQRLENLTEKFRDDKKRLREEAEKAAEEAQKQRDKQIQDALNGYDPDDTEYDDYQ